jgi:hypothetical protein
MLGGMFLPEKEGVTRLYNHEVHNLQACSSENITGMVKVKVDKL